MPPCRSSLLAPACLPGCGSGRSANLSHFFGGKMTHRGLLASNLFALPRSKGRLGLFAFPWQGQHYLGGGGW